MNKIFKVIYSKTRHCYVVVSELAKSHCKSTTGSTLGGDIAPDEN
ncbi:ESPR domain-containing protein [uncultured Megasphaera sp.]